MTASEPLSIEEEYDMQKSWREDSRKCTFIVLRNDESSTDEIGQMAGDVNLFLNRDDDGGLTYAEIDVMIAEERFRKQGMGEETVLLMMWYGITHLNTKKFFAKINKVNESSIKLFKRLQYKLVNYVEAFEEYEYQFSLEGEDGEEARKLILDRVSLLQFRDYEADEEDS